MSIKLKLTPKRCMHPKVYNPNNDFYIYSCVSDNTEVEKHYKYGTFSILGKMQRLDLDVEYTAEIEVDKIDPIHGVSYSVINIYQEIPKTAEAQKDYLRALITDNQINEIYKAYPNDDIIELFKDNKLDYKKVKGFGEATYKRVRKKIIDNLDYQELFSSLGKYGVTYGVIVKLMEEFGSAELAIQKVRNNAYELTKIHGVGFKKADAIARNMAKEEIEVLLEQGSINRDQANEMFVEKVFKSPFRIQSAIKHIIEQEQTNGHTYIEQDNLLKNGIELLQIDYDLIEKQISQCDNIYIEGTKIALKSTYDTEEYISEWIKKRLKNNTELKFNVEDFISRMEEKYNISLSNQQKSFFDNVKNNNVNLLVGYAGCGKSMLQKLLRDLLIELGLTAKWIAPTGNAAKVLGGYIGEKAYTAHKAIGYGQNKEEKDLIIISEDFVVIDESSMLDVFIASAILKKIKNPSTRILFIGDSFQIPSVSSGNLLHDALESGCIPTTKLDIVFRQSEGGILDIMTKIRLNQKFIDNNFTGMIKFGDNMIIHCVAQEWMVDGYKHYYKLFLKKYKPEEIMVLSATKKGSLGTVSINKEIQSLVNPPSPDKVEIEFGEDGVLREGDYVINTRNTYGIENADGEETDIVNGDKGIIYDIVTDWKPDRSKYKDDDEEEKDLNGVYINFDQDDIKINMQEKFQLLHAWCLTKHKSQGGNAKSVLVIADKSHKWQLSANLLYVAGTRATEFAVIVCQADVINSAMKKVENLRRNTFLYDLLRG